MTARDQPSSASRTLELRVPGANCPWCFNDAIDKIRQTAGVTEVRASIHDDCIEIQHQDVPTALLVSTLRTYLHGSDNSSHECQMIAIEPELVPPACGGVESAVVPTSPGTRR